MVEDRLLDFFSARGVPVVSIGRAPGRDDIPSVDIQSTATARLMLEHLGANSRRVGLITGEQRRNSYIETEAVYAAYAAERGFSPVALRIDESGGESEAAAAAERLLRSNPDIDALCVPVDAFARGCSMPPGCSTAPFRMVYDWRRDTMECGQNSPRRN
ncbi:hypothetical protein N0Q90_29285 (plasmid) [Sinorhizobium sp. M103]|nr:hypothetical protein [Sinorhizobium sp. M103]WEJ12700.1 hypothetical protein N0Q90_29285 [Sinorhizobium sp. M103]